MEKQSQYRFCREGLTQSALVRQPSLQRSFVGAVMSITRLSLANIPGVTRCPSRSGQRPSYLELIGVSPDVAVDFAQRTVQGELCTPACLIAGRSHSTVALTCQAHRVTGHRSILRSSAGAPARDCLWTPFILQGGPDQPRDTRCRGAGVSQPQEVVNEPHLILLRRAHILDKTLLLKPRSPRGMLL